MSPRFRTYSDAVRYLDSFVSYEKTPPPKYCEKTHYQLDRFRNLLSSVGHPERQFRSVHIAGTDGKGSTASFLAALLRASGYRVGLYTSPHLFDYTERIRLNGRSIPKTQLTQLLGQLADELSRLSVHKTAELPFFATVFELLTAAAFLYFARQKVDFAVIETGLGGRLDATNLIHPVLSILTPVDLEHTHLLGKTLTKVATEKAGIIKPQTAVFTSLQKPAVLRVFAQKCQQMQSSLFQLSDFLRISKIQPSFSGYSFRLGYNDGASASLVCPLLGRHQVDNFALALLAAQYLLDDCPATPNGPGSLLLEKTSTAFVNFSWAGRAEVFRTGKTCWILDAAHSPQAARSLRSVLNDLFPNQPVTHLLAFSNDKNVAQYVRQLVRPNDRLQIYRSSHPRAMQPEMVFQQIPLCYKAQSSISTHITELLSREMKNNPVLCVSGSVFWVADVRRILLSSTPQVKK